MYREICGVLIMNRFFKSDISTDDKIIINDDDAFHISSVLRLKTGDEIIVCDGNSNDYICEIETISKNEIVTKVTAMKKNLAEPKIEIILFQGMPKSDKMELIIQKCVELGVSKIVPVITEFTISRPSVKKDNKINRLRKISESAAKQSGRGVIPEVSDIVGFKQCISIMRTLSASIVAYEKENENSLKSFLKAFKGNSLGILIGPEGGFSVNEISMLKENGVAPISLGQRILRTETAGFAVISIINYELECF